MILLVCFAVFTPQVEAASTDAEPKAGLELARTIAKITGVAISPMLGVGTVGAWEYFSAPKEKKATLSWYARPAFWIPALLLVALVACKDAFGTVLPPGLKKPVDVAETIENKISGLVAAGAFVPLVTSVFHGNAGNAQAILGHGLNTMGLASIDLAPLLNILLVPFAMAAFVLVWLVGHAITVLILISPFGAVDAALKAARVSLMSLVTVTSFANPTAGAIFCVIIIILAYFLAGWSFRMMVFGSVFVWDFASFRNRRFKPAPSSNWMFTAREIEKTPIRSYGKLARNESGELTFEYRPWLFLRQLTLTMPQVTYAVGRGLFYPEIMTLSSEGEKELSMLSLPPRYRSHEEEIARSYKLSGVQDVGLLKGFKAIWGWLKGFFGMGAKPAFPPAPL